MEQASTLSESIQGQLSHHGGLPAKTVQDIQQKCKQLHASIEEINEEQQRLSIRYQLRLRRNCYYPVPFFGSNYR